MNAMESKDDELRGAAIWALCRIAHPRSLVLMLYLLKFDNDAYVSDIAACTLVRIGGKRAITAVREYLKTCKDTELVADLTKELGNRNLLKRDPGRYRSHLDGSARVSTIITPEVPMMRRSAWCCVLVSIGCSVDRGMEVAPNPAGIARVTTEHSDGVVVVRGLAETGDEIVSATVRHASVRHVPDASHPTGLALGTELIIAAGQDTFRKTSIDSQGDVVTVPLPPIMAAFTALAPVAAAIEAEARITFRPKLAGGYRETAYTFGPAPGELFPTYLNGGDSSEACVQQVDDEIRTFHQTSGLTVGSRLAYASHRGDACKISTNWGAPCNGMDCDVGACGFIATGAMRGPNVVVFYPHYQSPDDPASVCGVDVNADGAGDGIPQDFDDQEVAPDMVASCDCRMCTEGHPEGQDHTACTNWGGYHEPYSHPVPPTCSESGGPCSSNADCCNAGFCNQGSQTCNDFQTCVPTGGSGCLTVGCCGYDACEMDVCTPIP